MFFIGLATIMTVLVATVIWQQAQLRYLRDMVTQAMRPEEVAEPSVAAEPEQVAAVGHYDTEQLFFRGQTRH